MTVGAIIFDLGGGTSPFRVTLPDASGLAPLDLPTPFLDDGELKRQPPGDAISRFEAAMSGGDAYSALAERPLRIPREIVVPAPIPVPPPEVDPGRAASTMPPETPVPGGRGATALPRGKRQECRFSEWPRRENGCRLERELAPHPPDRNNDTKNRPAGQGGFA